MSSKRSSSRSSAGGPSSKKTSSSSSSSGSDNERVETVFAESTFSEVTCVYTYCGGWVNIDARIKKLIKSIIIVDGVTEIAEKVGCLGLFNVCTALTSITFPDNGTFVKIGSWALLGCISLVTLAVPDSCVDIADFALFRCSSLTTFTFPNKSTKLNESILSRCSSLTTLNISDDCVEINIAPMKNCSSLTTLAIPNACTRIRKWAFIGCTTLRALADKSNLTIEQFCRKQWRSSKLLIFKVNLFASYNVLNRLRLSDPLMSDPLIDKTSILWVLYDKITSDDVRRKITEFLDYRWMGFNNVEEVIIGDDYSDSDGRSEDEDEDDDDESDSDNSDED